MEAPGIQYYLNIFDDYVQKFDNDTQSENIRLKIRHSYAVCNNIIKLSLAENLRSEQMRRAKIVAIFHDIARFLQFDQFGTFRDDLSFNHAEKGVQILKEENILSEETKKSRDLINAAIRFHNRESIPANKLDKNTLCLSKLIRDADKLDIFETSINYHLSNKPLGEINSAIELDLPESSQLHPGAVKDILQGRIVDSDHVASVNDLILLQMGWVFDINFQSTMKIIKARQYIPKLSRALSSNGKMDKIMKALNRRIEKVATDKVS
ncbi:MAG: HD domain-containing protein [Candidatus Marinimicrobia bacterium]|nr:HD domain-containing protein [Candidatus Neomarinimicrobiota bacterium]